MIQMHFMFKRIAWTIFPFAEYFKTFNFSDAADDYFLKFAFKLKKKEKN